MPQLHLYVPEDLAAKVREKAKARNLTVSRYLAAIVGANATQSWPPRFFDEVVGGWHGKPLRRSSQRKLERREAF